MPILTFVGKSGEPLVCSPPNPIDTDNKVAALVHFSPVKKCIVLANFVEGSTIKDGTRKILGVGKFAGPPIYHNMTHTGNVFKLEVVGADMNDLKKKEAVLAIVDIRDK